MDTSNTTNTTDDQELAKVLESMNQQAGGTPPADDASQASAEPVNAGDGLAFEETPPADTATTDPVAPLTDEPVVEEPATEEPVVTTVSQGSPELDSIKKSALEELRPLVDKLDLPADEKFDTLLLLIRSTDDQSLVNAAHEAARNIGDETKRAQALLDVIKEIDYFSGHGPQPS